MFLRHKICHKEGHYRKEPDEALQRLADHIDAIERGCSNVTALRRP